MSAFVDVPAQPTAPAPPPVARRANGAGGGGKGPRLAPRRGGSGPRGAREPVAGEVAAFAPATIANLGPGFDWLGCAVKGNGDTVVARPNSFRPGSVNIDSIEGAGGRLSLKAHENCAGIAALKALEIMGRTGCGVSLSLKKGLPLGSGMGSSAASAAAGAMAVNLLFGEPLSREELVVAGLAAESAVSGYHADNIAPALLGGFVLVRSYSPLDLHRLDFPNDLWFVLVTPQFEAPTAMMRSVLPKTVPMGDAVRNGSMGAVLVASILCGDCKLLGQSLNSDRIVEPVRGPLIPGFCAAKAAAMEAGAFGCTIGGAGPTTIAVVPSQEAGNRVATAMAQAFKDEGGLGIYNSQVVQLDKEGATSVPRPSAQRRHDNNVVASPRLSPRFC